MSMIVRSPKASGNHQYPHVSRGSLPNISLIDLPFPRVKRTVLFQAKRVCHEESVPASGEDTLGLSLVFKPRES